VVTGFVDGLISVFEAGELNMKHKRLSKAEKSRRKYLRKRREDAMLAESMKGLSRDINAVSMEWEDLNGVAAPCPVEDAIQCLLDAAGRWSSFSVKHYGGGSLTKALGISVAISEFCNQINKKGE